MTAYATVQTLIFTVRPHAKPDGSGHLHLIYAGDHFVAWAADPVEARRIAALLNFAVQRTLVSMFGPVVGEVKS